MRIGLVVTGGLDPTGRERVVPTLVWLLERLARSHEVHAFVLRYFKQPRTYPMLGATVHDLGRVEGPPGLRLCRMSHRLRRALVALGAAHRPQLLHAYLAIPAGLVATRVARQLGIPTIVTLDSGELVGIDDIGYGLQRTWHDRRAVRSTVRRADTITTGTRFMSALLEQCDLGRRPEVVPIGVDTACFPADRRTPGPPWRLLRVASLNRVKDYPLLLETLVRLRSRHNLDVHLDVVGEDTLGGTVQEAASRLSVTGHVTFHGFQPTDRLRAFYARAHLHVVTSRHEAAGVVTLEAASTGLPTVGTDVGYIADWQPDRAVAVDGRDPDRLAAAIVELLNDTTRRERLAGAARAWTLEHDADWTARQFERLYADVTTQRRAR